ncbi:uncharacterized protein LOC110425514 [Herrania umbratica]|uniref:Uncharacterized protein LOC110425514 n=1 Tax=Herrania umbratica TaxID=108875 RepID=A0A6J1BAB4_9ROSI|nr:uncharacterized protein LOC110425514 [Herrania umbratica]
MGAQELNHGLETLQQNNDSWQEFGDEAEETLSLCDLVISSDANEYWNDEQHQRNTSPSSSDHQHQDLFEFFSTEDFPAAAAAAASSNHQGNNIIFCGKLIPYRGQQQSNEDKTQSLESKVVKPENGTKNGASCLFPWRTSQSFNKSRTFPSSSSSSSASAKASQGKRFNKSLSLPAVGSKNSKKLGDDKFDFSVKKVSVIETPVKSRWYLFAFGVGRFPMEIELKDMKMRQSRKTKAMKLQQDGQPENAKCNKERRRSAKGLWRLLKVLGWKNKHTNAAVVQASYSCIPHV